MILHPKVFLFSQMGVGKSTAAIKAFGRHIGEVRYIAVEPNAYAPATSAEHNPSRRMPRVSACWDPKTAWTMAQTAAKTAIAEARNGTSQGIILDTLSTLAHHRLRELKGNRDSIMDRGKTYARLSDDLFDLVAELVAAPVPVIVLSHERTPKWYKDESGRDKLTSGGGAFLGQMAERMVRLFDLAIRMDRRPGADGSTQRVFLRNELDVQWLLKDRWDVIVDGAPADLRAACRAIYAKQNEMLS